MIFLPIIYGRKIIIQPIARDCNPEEAHPGCRQRRRRPRPRLGAAA